MNLNLIIRDMAYSTHSHRLQFHKHILGKKRYLILLVWQNTSMGLYEFRQGQRLLRFIIFFPSKQNDV